MFQSAPTPKPPHTTYQHPIFFAGHRLAAQRLHYAISPFVHCLVLIIHPIIHHIYGDKKVAVDRCQHRPEGKRRKKTAEGGAKNTRILVHAALDRYNTAATLDAQGRFCIQKNKEYPLQPRLAVSRSYMIYTEQTPTKTKGRHLRAGQTKLLKRTRNGAKTRIN